MSSQATSDYRRRRKQNLIKVCGNRCNICGYDKTVSALEFHHIDPSSKDYAIGAQGTCRDIQKDLNEIKKCILVCSNCHREIHEGIYSTEELLNYKIFDEKMADSLVSERNEHLYGKVYVCSQCGKEITSGAKTGLCSSCYTSQNRVVKERPLREELKILIRNYSFAELGRRYGVSDNAIRKWCKAVNLPYRVKDIQAYSDQDWEKI